MKRAYIVTVKRTKTHYVEVPVLAESEIDAMIEAHVRANQIDLSRWKNGPVSQFPIDAKEIDPKDFPDRFEGARTYEVNISVTVTLDPTGLPEEGTHAFKLVLAENLREILQDLSYQDLETLAGTYISSYRLIDERWEELKTAEAGGEQ